MRNIEVIRKIFNELYQDKDGIHISLAERKRLNIGSKEFVYGEVVFDTFVDLLKKAGINENDIFYDLGSGLGKPCLIASLVFDVKKAVGIELLPALYQLSTEIAQKASQLVPDLKNLIFLNQDMLEADFSDGTLVFCNSTCLSEESLAKLEKKFEKLQSGSRVILITKKIENENLSLKEEGEVKMTWGMATFRIYERK